MRFARVALGLLLALVGLLVALAGAVAAFWLVGPDNTVDTGEQQLGSKGLAVVTAPDLIDRHGPTLHVTVTGNPKPVFVGVGQELDVTSYLGTSAYTQVVRLSLPPKFDTQEMKGGAAALSKPAGLDWWAAKASGSGEQSVAWPMADGRYSVVVMNADGRPGTDARVTLGVELPGLFVTFLLVLGAGLVLLIVGLLLMFMRRRRPETPEQMGPPVPQYQPMAFAQQQSASTQPTTSTPPPAYTPPSTGSTPQPGYTPPPNGPTPPTGSTPPPGYNTPPPGYTPPPQYPKGPVRRTKVIAGGIGLLLVATGCASVPAKNVKTAAASRPAVAVADGQAVVKRYNEVNNKANQARDAKLSETVEGEPTLAQTRAGFKISLKVDVAGKDKIKPFTYTKPKIGAPQFSAYPMRFVMSSTVSGQPDNQALAVWERATAGSPWVLTNCVYPAATMKVPAVDGLRVPTKADLNKLASLPQSAATNLAAYLSGGTRSPKASIFAPSPGTVGLLTNRAKEKIADAKESYISTVTDTFMASGDPLTFITSSGEALVFLSVAEQYMQRIEPGSNAYWARGSATAFSSGVRYTQTLNLDYLHQVALVIPAKGKGKLRILSIDGQLVGAGGS
ncbi:hypothetical protein EV643_101376 [Kribbella sp. VKM Ac-2527]|uniref:DUF8094 domain-containing protein n=1 Tax=Kribbella caucasensis TaxID=2512215 RepID=A0A4R6KPI5_9ACTN|nr:hypothetical protein [Kribbella sp. VKM Ac-2527]TDO54586.1 hypothetical protein EV643_101376 [Kribbella sp. VKM Ac-2527]